MISTSSLPDLVERLRLIAPSYMPDGHLAFSPEDVARGLEAAIQAVMWCTASHGHLPDRERAIEAFLAAAGANPKEGE